VTKKRESGKLFVQEDVSCKKLVKGKDAGYNKKKEENCTFLTGEEGRGSFDINSSRNKNKGSTGATVSGKQGVTKRKRKRKIFGAPATCVRGEKKTSENVVNPAAEKGKVGGVVTVRRKLGKKRLTLSS